MKKFITLLVVLFVLPLAAFAQETEEKKKEDKPERPAFDSATLIDNPTNVVFNKGTLEVMIQHRFDYMNAEGDNTLLGMWGASNIRLGLAYSPIDRVALGFGTTKDYRLQDFNWKVALLEQTRSGRVPLSITYYGNFVVDARSAENQINLEQDRYTFFNQVIFTRRFSPNFSLQIAPSISHFNAAPEGTPNDVFAIAIGGRAKITPGTSIVFDYSQPLESYDFRNEKLQPGLSLGFEFGTSAHTFQIFASNYKGIVPQYNYMQNTSDFFSGDVLIGFNITRNYNF